MSEIAIDFGTARTKIARLDNNSNKPCMINLGRETPWAIPSVFYIPKEGPVLVGDEAQDAYKRDPRGIVRGLKMELHKANHIRRYGRKFERVELAAELFRWIRQECDRQVFHDKPVTKCTLTVPPGFGCFEIDCLKKASLLGGFTSVEIIEEPVSAARSWLAFSATQTRYITVLDIGGGTSDIALVKQEGNSFFVYPDLPPQGIPRGGNDIDHFLFDLLDLDDKIPKGYSSSVLIYIRKAKEQIIPSNRVIKFTIAGEVMSISYEMVEDCCRKFLDEIVGHVFRFGEKIRDVVGADLSDTPILLVGGGRYIIGIQKAIETIWPTVYTWEDSERATVLGALVQGMEKSKTNSIEIEKYRRIVKSYTVPSENSDLETIEAFLNKLGLLNKMGSANSDLSAPIRDKIENECWGKTAAHLEEIYKLKIRLINKNMREKAQAVKYFKEAVELWENEKGTTDIDEVIKYCNIAFSFSNSYYPPLYLNGLALAKKGEYEQAIEIIDRFLLSSGQSRGVLFKIGCFRLKTSLPQKCIEAIKNFTSALHMELAEDTEEINAIIPTIDNNTLMLYRAYAAFYAQDYEQCFDNLEALVDAMEISNQQLPNDFSPALLLALQCRIRQHFNKNPNFILYEKLFKNGDSFQFALENLENRFADFSIWREWFNKPHEIGVFRDQMKTWLLSDLQHFFEGNKQNAIQRFIEIVGPEIDSWIKSSGDYMLPDPVSLLLVAAVFVEMGKQDFAETYALKVWELDPIFPFLSIKSNHSLINLMKSKKLFPNFDTKIKNSMFSTIFFVTNTSPYNVNNVRVDFQIVFSNGSSSEMSYSIDKMIPGKPYDMKKSLPIGITRKDKIKINKISCDEIKLIYSKF